MNNLILLKLNNLEEKTNDMLAQGIAVDSLLYHINDLRKEIEGNNSYELNDAIKRGQLKIKELHAVTVSDIIKLSLDMLDSVLTEMRHK